MAPSTACALILLGGGIFLNDGRPSGRARLRAIYAATAIATLWCLAILAQHLLHADWGLEAWAGGSGIEVERVQIGRMSPPHRPDSRTGLDGGLPHHSALRP